MNQLKTVLKFVHKAILGYLIVGTPVFLACLFYVFLKHGNGNYLAPETGFWNLVNNMGFGWILSLAYFFLALVFYGDFRESLMSRIAGFKENDEREELATAKAARHTFLLMLALQTVFLVMSMTTIKLERTPDGHGILTIGMSMSSNQHLNFSNAKTEAAAPASDSAGLQKIERWLLPPNFFAVLAFLILAQIAGFRLFSWRAYKG